MSYAVKVLVCGESKWSGNALRFNTEAEAKDYGRDLMGRWFAVKEISTELVNDPVNYSFINGTLEEKEN